MNGGKGGVKKRRSYRPTVEALEALRMLSSATQILPDLAVERGVMGGPLPLATDQADTGQVWDEALTQTHLADLFRLQPAPFNPTAVAPSDPTEIAAGLSRAIRN